MNLLKSLLPTEQARKVFPKKGWAWYVKMAKSRYELLKLVVTKMDNKEKIMRADLLKIYEQYGRNSDETAEKTLNLGLSVQ